MGNASFWVSFVGLFGTVTALGGQSESMAWLCIELISGKLLKPS